MGFLINLCRHDSAEKEQCPNNNVLSFLKKQQHKFLHTINLFLTRSVSPFLPLSLNRLRH